MGKPFVFHIRCVEANGEDINDMRDLSWTVSYENMLRHCDLVSWAAEMKYSPRPPGLTLKRDCHVSYHRSFYRGHKCFYLVHSHIEYIWLERSVVLPPPAPNRSEGLWDAVREMLQ